MGLDITAYTNLKPSEVTTLPDGNGDGYFKPGSGAEWSEQTWPGRAEGIELQQVYEYEQGTEFRFRAGSYSGYSDFRNDLARMVGHVNLQAAYTDPKPGPFIEILDFADNEGLIGPIVAAKLAKDFEQHQSQAVTMGPIFFDSYQKWWRAFVLASQAGAVHFR